MPKNLLEDMVRIKSAKRETISERDLDSEVDDKFDSYYKNISIRESKRKNKEGKPKNPLWFIALVSALFLFFAISSLFSNAKITVTPKQKKISLNMTLPAVKDSTSDKELPFTLTLLSGNSTTIVPAGTPTSVTKSATGTVTIYNNYSSESQRLDINTRLEGSNGKTYKTNKQITVPGMTGNTPGSIDVDVYATDPGESYNSSSILNFTIVGFKGTSKYSKFYAKSKGDLSGGLIGQSSSISDDQKNQAINELKSDLQQKLFQKLSDKIPTGFVLFKNAVLLNIDNVTVDSTTSNSQISITLNGTLYGFLFNESKITQKIVAYSISDYDGSSVHISNINDLGFTLPNNIDISSLNSLNNIIFTLTGNPNIVWNVDTEKLSEDLLGKKKKDFTNIMAQYPNIVSAKLVVRPIWKFSFPDDIKDIKIITTNSN